MTEKARKQIRSFEEKLRSQINDRHYPNVNPETARHELYGYLCAMRDIGLITDDECIVRSDAFGSESVEFIMVPLPDGRSLVAYDKKNEDHPGITVELHAADARDVMIAMIEYNTCRPDYSPEQRLRMLLWDKNSDDPAAVNLAYDTGEFEK